MSGFPIVDLVIGIIFIYFLLSIICSSAVELWFSLLGTRAKILGQWLEQIFDKPAFNSNGDEAYNKDGTRSTVGQEIMNHCMVTALSKPGKATSYIDAENFVSALLDKITIAPTNVKNSEAVAQFPPVNLPEFISAIKTSTLISGELKRTILIFANEATNAAALTTGAVGAHVVTEIKSDLDHFRSRLERWYDTNADRLTGKLKKSKVLPATFILATIITVSLNVDTINICKYLYNNKDISKQLAAAAVSNLNNYAPRLAEISAKESARKNGDTTAITLARWNENTIQLKNDIENLQSLELPIGWTKVKESFPRYFFQLQHIGGWLATIFAICMGAPFWFDLLNKIANLRGVGPKPSSSSNAKDGSN